MTGWLHGEENAMEKYCTEYKHFLNVCKTERECVDQTVALAEQAGFRRYDRGMPGMTRSISSIGSTAARR